MSVLKGLTVVASLVAVAVCLAPVEQAAACSCCPFCGAASLTLSEQLAEADAAVLLQWTSAVKPEKDDAGKTEYTVVQVVKGGSAVEKGAVVKIDRFRAAKKGDLFFVLGTFGDVPTSASPADAKAEGKTAAAKPAAAPSKAPRPTVIWGSPLEVTETSFNYIAQAPAPEAQAQKRLAYFLKFLEFSDPLVANDAFAEFANAQYKDVSVLAAQFPREKLRKWIVSPDTNPTRLGLFGMMLGLCGDESDAKVMAEVIEKDEGDFRLGIDGVMGGYLLIKKEAGLPLIEKSKLTNKKAAFSEVFSAMQALRFMWTYGEERIGPDRLRQSMRLLLDRPEVADLVIADLARWKDWEVRGRLMTIYGADEYDIPTIKRAIVRYLLNCSKDVPKEAGACDPLPAHAADALVLLKQLRAKDEKTVAEAERFFMP